MKPKFKIRFIAVASLLCLLVLQVPDVISQKVAWPLRVSEDKHYLEDQNGVPFFIQAETVWDLGFDLTKADIDFYLDEMYAKGFNTIYMKIKTSFNTDATGRVDFFDNDITQPNEEFFSDILDHIVRKAKGRDMLVAGVMIWHKNGINTVDGKRMSPLKYTAEQMAEYGRFLGARYSHENGFGNMMYVGGGDFPSFRAGDGVDRLKYEALARGVLEANPQAIVTYHSGNGRSSLDDWGERDWIIVNSLYQRQGPFQWEHALENWRKYHELMPIIVQEGLYETACRRGWCGTPLNIRKQQWWYLTCGSAGCNNYGHERIFGFKPIWKGHLNDEARCDMIHIKEFFAGLKWWIREPDTDSTILVGGRDLGNDRATACRAGDGSYVIVYTPNASDPLLDMSALSGPSMSRWHNPRNGEFLDPGGPYTNTGVQSFRRPDREDWVLYLWVPGKN